jgi:serine/threonine protein kinase
MADIKVLQPREARTFKTSLAERRRHPPPPVRTKSAGDALHAGAPGDIRRQGSHHRHKSTVTASNVMRRTVHAPRRSSVVPQSPSTWDEESATGGASQDSIPEDELLSPSNVLSPPMTPDKGRSSLSSDEGEYSSDIMAYDFSKLDYELERARVIGQGLWSTVFLADAKQGGQATGNLPTPPSTPLKRYLAGPSSVFAVKTPARRDAKDVFRQEAKVLTHLMRQPCATQHIVTFHGLDARNSALVFEAVLGGSLENLNGRLRQMTEVSRHLELVCLFPGLAEDLISGLDFLHSAGVVHADIKPANVLLDISEHYSLPRPVIRARYIDFSASFRLGSDDSTANAGGTWDYMAPEQMRIQKDLNTPTFASDVWSLGITLLSLLVGESPYTAACGNQVMRIREAIKTGDPLSFARTSPKVQKRMAACQDVVDCCRLALKKDREKRVSAAVWKLWVENWPRGDWDS